MTRYDLPRPSGRDNRYNCDFGCPGAQYPPIAYNEARRKLVTAKSAQAQQLFAVSLRAGDWLARNRAVNSMYRQAS